MYCFYKIKLIFPFEGEVEEDFLTSYRNKVGGIHDVNPQCFGSGYQVKGRDEICQLTEEERPREYVEERILKKRNIKEFLFTAPRNCLFPITFFISF